MSKLRKVQFFRNSSLTAYANHAAAVNAAELAWKAQGFANMEDGELLLYRYTISGETGTPAHTIVGVVRNDGTNKYFEVLANYDMLTSQFDSLDVPGYEQAYITIGNGTSTLTVQGIQETDGLISAAATQGLTINIDGEYKDIDNKIATQSTVTNAVEALNGSATIASESNGVVTLKVGVQEVQGIISNDANTDITLAKVAKTGAAADVSIADSNNLFTATNVEDALAEVQGNVQTVQGNLETVAASIKDGAITWNDGTIDVNVFSANTNTNLTLRQHDFVYDSNELGVNVQTATSATNKIATMADIASLTGAMHYKGGVTEYPTPTADTKAGDTYIVTQRFEHPAQSGNWYEVGDMLVATADGTSATYTVVQSNLTLGMGTGEVAANQTALTVNQIVVAGSTGVQTTGYTFDAESTAGNTTIGSDSTNAQVPTSKNVYDAIQDLAVNSVSETVGVGTVTDGASITDTLTVDGTASTQTVNIVATQGVSVTPDAGTQTITLAAKVADYAHVGNTTTVTTETDAYNLLKVDASGNLSVSDTWDCGTY